MVFVELDGHNLDFVCLSAAGSEVMMRNDVFVLSLRAEFETTIFAHGQTRCC